MDKDFLTANLKVFFKKFFDTEISENDIKYICQDMEPHSVAVLMTEYIEHIIGDSDPMLPHIEEFIVSMMNKKIINKNYDIRRIQKVESRGYCEFLF